RGAAAGSAPRPGGRDRGALALTPPAGDPDRGTRPPDHVDQREPTGRGHRARSRGGRRSLPRGGSLRASARAGRRRARQRPSLDDRRLHGDPRRTDSGRCHPARGTAAPDWPRGALNMIRSILLVCSGNTCRSPLAAAMLRAALAERPAPGEVRVGSAGTGAWDGAPASEGSYLVALERGLDLSTHRARMLTTQLVREADLILTMTTAHSHRVIDMGGAG